MSTGSAAINVYHHDGTVLLSHGGVEMGQGLNTKMMQIASQELHVPMEIIRVTPNSTDKVHIGGNSTSVLACFARLSELQLHILL